MSTTAAISHAVATCVGALARLAPEEATEGARRVCDTLTAVYGPAAPSPLPDGRMPDGLTDRIRVALADGGGTVRDIARYVHGSPRTGDAEPTPEQADVIRVTLHRLAKASPPEAVKIAGWWMTPERAAAVEGRGEGAGGEP